MKIVRFRGRTVALVAISLVFAIALIRTSLVALNSPTANDDDGGGDAILSSRRKDKKKFEPDAFVVRDKENMDWKNAAEDRRKAFFFVDKSSTEGSTSTPTLSSTVLIDDKDNVPLRGDIRPPLLISNNNVPSYSNNEIVGNNQRKIDENNVLPEQLTNKQLKYPLLVNKKFVPLRRIVHLDLKGAHPKLHFIEKFFNLISKLGATGVLIEYEDTFPYTGELAAARSKNAYSEKDVKTIVKWAAEYNLELIPLVQTFGHLEWILKHEKFTHFREVERYAQVICLSNFDAVSLIKMAIDQVMAFHKDTSKFFHMGADEAFQIGMCSKCQKTIHEQLNNSRDRLMLRHIANISSHVRDKYKKRVLMWHDMLVNVDTQAVKDYQVDKLVEPVIWAYAENLDDYLTSDTWSRFSSTFPYIWGCSAYKGADGPSRFYSNVPHYLQNHLSWSQQMTREYRNFKEFRGLILAGWQRFDHFAILCELLPVGIPSLAVNMLSIEHGVYDRQILDRVSRVLGCSGTFEIESSSSLGGYCQFPGAKIYQLVQQFHAAQKNLQTQLYDDYQLRGWLSPFNMQHNYSSAWYLDQIVDKISMYRNDVVSLSKQLRLELEKIFFEDAIDEFFFEYIKPDLDKLENMFKSAKNLLKIKYFPGRPFAILDADTKKSNVDKNN